MDLDEVIRLKQISGLKEAFNSHDFSKSRCLSSKINIILNENEHADHACFLFPFISFAHNTPLSCTRHQNHTMYPFTE